MKKGIVSILEITDRHVKFLEARYQRNAWVLTNGAVESLHLKQDDHVQQILSQMISREKIEKENLILVIPRSQGILKQMTLPSQSAEEIRRMIDLQIVGQVPFSRDDTIFDFKVLEKDAKGYTKALVVVVHKERVHRLLNILSGVGLFPQSLGFSSFGVVASYQFVLENGNQQNDGAAVLIDMDTADSDICFVQQGQLFFSRNVHYGLKDFNFENVNFTASCKEFVNQLGLTIGTYKKERMGQGVSKIVIFSHVHINDQLKNFINDNFQLPIEVINPYEEERMGKKFKKADLFEKKMVSVCGALGYLLDDSRQMVNLMPVDVIDTKRLNSRRRSLIRSIFTIVLFLALGAGAMAVHLYHKMRYLDQLQVEADSTQRGMVNAEKKIESLRFIRDKIQHRIFFVDVINELHSLIKPQQMSLMSLELSPKGELTLQGFADTREAVNNFQSRMVEAKLFKDVNLVFVTVRKKGDGEHAEFKIVCRLVTSEETN